MFIVISNHFDVCFTKVTKFLFYFSILFHTVFTFGNYYILIIKKAKRHREEILCQILKIITAI